MNLFTHIYLYKYRLLSHTHQYFHVGGSLASSQAVVSIEYLLNLLLGEPTGDWSSVVRQPGVFQEVSGFLVKMNRIATYVIISKCGSTDEELKYSLLDKETSCS